MSTQKRRKTPGTLYTRHEVGIAIRNAFMSGRVYAVRGEKENPWDAEQKAVALGFGAIRYHRAVRKRNA